MRRLDKLIIPVVVGVSIAAVVSELRINAGRIYRLLARRNPRRPE